jgi:hypothetical protein
VAGREAQQRRGRCRGALARGGARGAATPWIGSDAAPWWRICRAALAVACARPRRAMRLHRLRRSCVATRRNGSWGRGGASGERRLRAVLRATSGRAPHAARCRAERSEMRAARGCEDATHLERHELIAVAGGGERNGNSSEAHDCGVWTQARDPLGRVGVAQRCRSGDAHRRRRAARHDTRRNAQRRGGTQLNAAQRATRRGGTRGGGARRNARHAHRRKGGAESLHAGGTRAAECSTSIGTLANRFALLLRCRSQPSLRASPPVVRRTRRAAAWRTPRPRRRRPRQLPASRSCLWACSSSRAATRSRRSGALVQDARGAPGARAWGPVRRCPGRQLPALLTLLAPAQHGRPVPQPGGPQADDERGGHHRAARGAAAQDGRRVRPAREDAQGAFRLHACRLAPARAPAASRAGTPRCARPRRVCSV